ncbi:MAG TPA: lytic transglycosylase domain-containing protein [Allosphingosinicella sp.]|jgi:soluble lytic murein transglycosylase-like protein|nr:lytic transglycosylase domain-containing protein [Allosphingosinicella sp.]
MIRFRFLLLAAALAAPALVAAPAAAQDAAERATSALPSVLTVEQRTAYRDIFAAIRAQDWLGATTQLDALPDGPLHAAAREELYLAKGSPKVELDPVMALLAKAPDLPKADQLARLAIARGAASLPPLPQPRQLVFMGSQPRRGRPQAVTRDPVSTEVDGQITPLINTNKPADAEAIFIARVNELTPDVQTEFQQRIAWSYYTIGDDASAWRLSQIARNGNGDWAVQAAWTAGLAAWRTQRCDDASDAFATVAARTTDYELAAAADYWGARADTMCGHPERVETKLRSAARFKETFYGLLAASALGIRTSNYTGLHDYRDAEWRSIADKPDVRAAIALTEIGETDLADQFIRYQAKIGGPGDHNALIHLACDLNMASTQLWLAHNAPAGTAVNVAARYPRPDWRPARGWRVDQSLVFAHALQESAFHTDIVSKAGAVGLMQVTPATAVDIARQRGEPFERAELNNPAFNMEFGQSRMEALRDMGATGGLLPKVIAAYDAGPLPVQEWNARDFGKGDPLLYIESIPYWETRGYVPIILRNYWVYEQEAGKADGSREALVQGLWPRYPGLPGARAVRLTSGNELAMGRD